MFHQVKDTLRVLTTEKNIQLIKSEIYLGLLCWMCSHIMPAGECISAPSFLLLACISAVFLVSCIFLSYVFRVLYILRVMYSASHVIRVSYVPCLITFASHVNRYLICFMSRLRLYLNPQATQAIFQHSDRVSSYFLTSSFVLQSVMCNKD